MNAKDGVASELPAILFSQLEQLANGF